MNVFDKAADVIRERGWTRGIGEDKDGRVCAGYALHCAAGLRQDGNFNSELHDAMKFAVAQIHPNTVGNSITLVGWNDRVAKDVDEVLHMFKRASEEWELQHANG